MTLPCMSWAHDIKAIIVFNYRMHKFYVIALLVSEIKNNYNIFNTHSHYFSKAFVRPEKVLRMLFFTFNLSLNCEIYRHFDCA